MTGEDSSQIMMVCPPHSQMSKYSGGDVGSDSNVILSPEIQRKINFLSGLMRKQTMERDIITR